MKQRIRLGSAIAGLALLATTGCTVSGLPWGDVKVTPDKSQFQLSGPVPNVQIADPQQYQGSIKNGTDTYVEVKSCNSHYGVTCRDGDVVYVFDNYIYLGYAYVWDGYWWTVPIGGGKSYDYYNHTYVDWTMVDASQINISQNISTANQFIDQHVEVYNQTSPSTGASAVTATSPKPGDPAASPSPGSSVSPSPRPTGVPTPTPTPTGKPTPSTTPPMESQQALPSATPTKGTVSSATLSLDGCTSGTLRVSGVSSSAQLSIQLSSSSGTLYSSSKASSDGGGSSWTKSLSGLDLGKPTERTMSVNAVIDEWSDTLSVAVPAKCLASTPTPSATPSATSSSSYSSSGSGTSSSPKSSTKGPGSSSKRSSSSSY